MEGLQKLLAEHPFFHGFPVEFVTFLTSCARNVRCEPGEFLFRREEPAGEFYLIRDGHVSVELHGAERGTLVLQTVGAGEVLGWSWIVPPYRWRFDARAVEPTRVLALHAECLRKKCEQDPRVGYEILKRLMRVMAERLEAARVQLLDLYGGHAGA